MEMNSNSREDGWRRFALSILALGAAGYLSGIFLGNEVGAQIALLLTPVFPVSLIALGALRNGRLGPIRAPLLLVALLLEFGLVAMLILRQQVMITPWIGGLPLAAVVQIYLLWVVPFIIVAVVYALTFDTFTLTEADLDRLDEATKG